MKIYFLTFILVFSSLSSGGSSAASPVFSVYGPVPGLEPSPFYSFRVRKAQDGLNHANSQWKEPFAMVTECTREKNCQNGQSKLGFENLDNWSNTYINFEMMEDNIIEIEITKLWGDPLVKAVVHPVTAALSSEVIDNSKAIVKINKPGLFTVDINGQMDDQDTGKLPEGGGYYQGPAIHTLTIFANPFTECVRLPLNP